MEMQAAIPSKRKHHQAMQNRNDTGCNMPAKSNANEGCARGKQTWYTSCRQTHQQVVDVQGLPQLSAVADQYCRDTY